LKIKEGWFLIGNELSRSFMDFCASIKRKDGKSVLTISLGSGYEQYDMTMLFDDDESAMNHVERYQDWGKRIKKLNNLK